MNPERAANAPRSVYEQQIARIVAAVDVQSPSSITIFGRAFAVPGIEQSPQAFARLSAFLQQRLYADHYITGSTEPPPDGRTVAQLGESPAFSEALLAANSGAGSWQAGWEIVGRDGASVSAARDDIVLRLLPDEWRAGSTTEPQIEMRMPAALRQRAPGSIIVLSDAPFDPDAGTLVRLYWNLTARVAAPLVRAVSTALNRAALPFRLKVLADPRAFARCDAAVLYLPAATLQDALPLLERVYLQVFEQLKARVPLFTRQIAPGVALAEDPPGGQESFGQQRCRLLAAGIVRAWERERSTLDARLREVAATFAEANIASDAPYLNPGSSDRYQISWSAPANQRHPHAQDGDEREHFLRVATDIGHALVDGAVCHDGRCTWLGPTTQRGEHWATLGPDLYEGSSGVALFLAELARLTGEPATRAAALGGMRQALHRVDELAPSQQLGLYTGLPGIALAAARSGTLLDAPELLDAAGNLAQRIAGMQQGTSELDLLSGSAGAIVGLIALGRLLAGNGRQFEPAATELAEELLAAAEVDATGYRWRARLVPDELPLTGFAHGASGIGYALAELFAITSDTRLRAAALEAFRWEDHWRARNAGHWPDFRGVSPRTLERSAGSPLVLPSRTYWCHGAPGIALARLRSRQLLDEPALLDDAVQALETTRAWIVDALANHAGYALCHGLAGNADILLLASRLLDPHECDSAALEHTARAVAYAGIERYAAHGDWPCGSAHGQPPGLMLGLAGIGLFYLRLVDPAIPAALLPSSFADS